VGYANPSDTSALVTFTVKDATGQTLDSVDRTLLPNGHAAQNMAGLFDLTSFTGSLEITSTQPIVTLALNAEAAPVFSSLPPGEVDAAPDVPGGGNNFGVGDTLPGVPAGAQLFPVSGWATEWSGVTFSATTDRSTTYLTFDDGGYIQLRNGPRYTCQATGGCRVGNGVISRGTFVDSGGTPAPPSGEVSIPLSPSVTTRFSPSQLIVGERAEFILNWNAVAGATSYKVRVQSLVPILYTEHPDGSCTVPSSETVHETSYTHEFTASFVNQFYFTVQACNSAGCSCPR